MEEEKMIIAIHEASHAVVAKFFEEYLILSEVTLTNQNMSSKNSLEGTLAGTLIRSNGDTINHGNATCYMLWAGFIGENIYRNGWDFVCHNLNAISEDPNKFDAKNADGDNKLFNKILSEFPLIERLKLRHKAFRFLIFFFQNEAVWNCVMSVADNVFNKNNQTLTIQELEVIFDNPDFADYLNLDRYQTLKDEGFLT